MQTGRRCVSIGKYNVIYADPPWRYDQKGVQGAVEKQYPTMGIEELCALPVADLTATDSALFMWATFPQLPKALYLMEAWGFQYITVAFVWLKKTARQTAGFMVWVFGRMPMQKYVFWGKGAIRGGRLRIYISLSFLP